MDHARITADAIVERYLTGDLARSEAEAFEEHYLGCQQCLDELADTLQLRESLHDLVECGELALPETASASRNWWRTPVWAAAATVLLAVSLTSVGVMYEKMQRVSGFSVNAAEVYALTSVRAGSSGPPVNTVQPQNSDNTLVFQVDPGRLDNDDGPFSVTFIPESGSAAAFVVEPLAPGFDFQLTLSVPARLLNPGDYRVEIREQGDTAVLNVVRFTMRYP